MTMLTRARLLAALLTASCLAASACGGDDDEPAPAGNDAGDGDGDGDGDPDGGDGDGDAGPIEPDPQFTCGDIVSDDDCDESLDPIVFVHGTFGSGDNIAHVALLFGSNGYCQDRFVAVDYNSLGSTPLAALDVLIDDIRERTGTDHVVLMGHSQGTGHCYTYLGEPAHAAKVSHYVHIAGGGQDAPPGGVSTLSLSSTADTLLGEDGVTGADETVVFETQDHFAVASSSETASAIWKFLYGADPQYTEIQCGDELITLEGVARTFGDNAAVAGGRLEVFELGAEPWERSGEPLHVLESDENGASPPVQLRRLVAHEFIGYDAAGAVIGHQYFAPMKRSNRLVRFISPSTNFLAAAPFNAIKRNDAHTVLVARSYQGAFRKDLGASLKIDGVEVLEDAFADEASATVGLFMFDDNQNGVSDGGSLQSYGLTPFVKGTDVFMSAEEPRFMEVEYDGFTLRVPNWPSASQGLTLAVFE